MFNIERVKQHTGLSDEQVRVLAQTFLEEVQVSCRKLDACFTSADWVGIRKLAHMLKPSYFLMGVAEGGDIIEYFLSIDPVQPNVGLLEVHVLHFQELALLLEQELVYVLRGAAMAVAE